jgi:hypothetical protein
MRSLVDVVNNLTNTLISLPRKIAIALAYKIIVGSIRDPEAEGTLVMRKN